MEEMNRELYLATKRDMKDFSVVPTIATVGQAAAAAGSTITFYKRQLPCPPAVEFSSSEGKLLFAEALADGSMDGFFKLIEQFRTQDEPAFCGNASLAMVLNSLSIDPKRVWKGPWRWFHEQMLDCCRPIAEIQKDGISLDQAACLARCNGAQVDVVRQDAISLSDFRSEVEAVCRQAEKHMIVSYSRKTLMQTGDGHFSPIGGFNKARDMVLILDTARFKYPVHWIPLPLLHQAMSLADPVTGKPRGFLKLGAHLRPTSVLFTIDLRSTEWITAYSYAAALPMLLAQDDSQLGPVERLLAAAPLPELFNFVAVRRTATDAAEACCRGDASCFQPEIVKQLLAELHSLRLFNEISRVLATEGPTSTSSLEYVAERICMLILATRQLWLDIATLNRAQQAMLQLTDVQHAGIVAAEVDFLKLQLSELPALEEAQIAQVNAGKRKKGLGMVNGI